MLLINLISEKKIYELDMITSFKIKTSATKNGFQETFNNRLILEFNSRREYKSFNLK